MCAHDEMLIDDQSGQGKHPGGAAESCRQGNERHKQAPENGPNHVKLLGGCMAVRWPSAFILRLAFASTGLFSGAQKKSNFLVLGN
jgi:hypothetical protein